MESNASPLSAAQKHEWEGATNFSKLPEKKDDQPMAEPKKLWLRGAITHPGIEKEKASSNGVSTHQQLEKDSHSPNPKIRGRGALGLRFQKGGDLHK